ncbi:conserved exported hypothetical protein [Methylocella tundrae]|uniref:Outer membrane protein beta-barrel domain-containing protein n=1 Tax=Methylocella tundrae TaxID=227605 RepID=A0A8B6M4W4_METTU|nr:outer membrane beta-barrel protein [Methylocella tundrae]VTZ49888.1 conserved exported hypothetical protein [Methylocella tundrae]
MNRALLVAAVAASSLLPPAPSSAGEAAPAALWQGFYGGVNWGVATGETKWSDPGGILAARTPRYPASSGQNGLFGGGQIGYNVTVGSWVAGLEGSGAASNLFGHAICGGALGAPDGLGWTCESNLRALGDVSGRAGYAVGRALIFGKAGAAIANEAFAVPVFVENHNGVRPAGGQTRFGWVVGAGVEYALWPHWSVKGEFDYYDFGPGQIGLYDPYYGDVSHVSIRHSVQLFKLGLNYRFNDEGPEISAPMLPILGDVTGEFGGRFGVTTGYFQKNLFAYSPILVSRLAWNDLSAGSIEGFARVDHSSGVFVKGFLGGGSLFGSHMTDEDYPPVTEPYSRTLSQQQKGNNFSAVADLGYSALRGEGWKIGGFVGYSYYQQALNAYGCAQVASSPICAPSDNIPAGQLILSETEHWNSIRLGLAGDVMLTDRVKLAAEAAWLPYTKFGGVDNHWLRPDINPMTETGWKGDGLQLEASLSYFVTDRVSIGVDGRYWSLRTPTGYTQFPNSTTIQRMDFKSGLYGAFVQIGYHFGGR